eukprot:10346161-Alexandrium_andersonii.AAC.1
MHFRGVQVPALAHRLLVGRVVVPGLRACASPPTSGPPPVPLSRLGRGRDLGGHYPGGLGGHAPVRVRALLSCVACGCAL